MLTVYHLGHSQSERIVWLCEELEIPYDLRRYDRDPATRLAPSDYKALHPLGAAPVIDDGSLRLAESGAIMEYILARYGNGRLVPAVTDAAFPDYLYWFHFTNGTLLPSLSRDLITGMLKLPDDHPMRQAMRARTDRAFGTIEAHLAEADFLAGAAFTAADIMMVFALTTMRLFAPYDLAPYPAIRAYLAHIGARDGYRRAMAKGDPDLEPMLD